MRDRQMSGGQKGFSIKKLWNACRWEAKKRFYACRYPAGILLGMSALIAFLPESACRWIDGNMGQLPVTVSIVFAIVMVLYLMVMPSALMSEPYGKSAYNRECMGDICTKTRILARLLLSMLQTAFFAAGGIAATKVMEKFATENHSYFRLALDGPVLQMILVFGAVMPMLYLTMFLWFYRRNQTPQHVVPYIIAIFLTELLSENLERNFRSWQGHWQMEVLWLAAAAVTAVICLYGAAKLED